MTALQQFLPLMFHFLAWRKGLGKPYDRPNMAASSSAHVCWKKAGLYLGVEIRYCECSDEDLTFDPQHFVDLLDENSILVCAILGSTLTGQYDDVQGLNDLLMRRNETSEFDVMIHVDAASGGFVAPFMSPQLVWDFRLPSVCSINVSGHKCQFSRPS